MYYGKTKQIINHHFQTNRLIFVWPVLVPAFSAVGASFGHLLYPARASGFQLKIFSAQNL
jgi:hypothetical protein